MNKTLIWDIPTRLFHWAFTASLTAAFVVAFAVDDDSPLYQLHMLFGLVAAFLLVLRIVLGLFGSRHARFSDFPLRPLEFARYLTGALSGRAKKYAGHNPGSAIAALAMFALVPALVLTGALGGGEAFEEVHEVLAYALLAAIGAHLLGLAIHTFHHRENIAASMATGRKNAPADEAIASGRPLWGLAFVAVAAAWITALFANHNAQAATVRLPLVGTVIQLGDNEGGENESRERGRELRHDDEKDDD
jgi:cytochrome b